MSLNPMDPVPMETLATTTGKEPAANGSDSETLRELCKNVCADDFNFDYPPIEVSFEGEIVKQTIADQYFESRYSTVDGDDYRILFHSNRVCLVTLAKSHSIVQKNKEIKKIEYKQSPGFKKKNKMNPETIVCVIQCEDGTVFKVRALVPGKVLEINENLISDPSLLVKEPFEDGYLFIVLPTIPDYEGFKKKYMKPEDYEGKIAQHIS